MTNGSRSGSSQRPQPERERHPAAGLAAVRAPRAPSTHGSASTAASISRHSASPPNRTGSSAGRPVSAAVASIDPARLGLVGDERRVERHRDDLRRRDEPGDLLVERG